MILKALRVSIPIMLSFLSGCGGRFLVPDNGGVLNDPIVCDQCFSLGCLASCINQCPSRCGSAGGDGVGQQDGGNPGGDGPQNGSDSPNSSGDTFGADSASSDGTNTNGDAGIPCNGSYCGPGQECINNSYCDDICNNERCAINGVCCPDAKPVCVFDRYCQAACPSASDDRCGSSGELCCDSTQNEICGASLTCVQNCGASQALCGDGTLGTYGNTCCPVGDVCAWDDCRTPTTPCDSFADCAPGEYCEFVLDPPDCVANNNCDLGMCLPDDAPPGYEQCQGSATDLFEPIFEWHWIGTLEGTCTGGYSNGAPCTDYTVASCYKNVWTSPVVADMDKKDEPELVWTSPISGKTTTFAAGKYPEVVIKAYGNSSTGSERIVILDGRTGETKKVICGDRGSYGHPTLGDIDGDAKLELINYEDTGVRVFDPFYDATAIPAEINTTWTQSGAPLNVDLEGGAPALTDLNSDGQAEIVVSGVVLNGATGAILANGGVFSSGNLGTGGIPVVADVDLDTIPEVVVGSRVFEYGGSPTWTATAGWNSSAIIGSGYPGVANFVDNRLPPWSNNIPVGADPTKDYPEIVVIRSGDVAILNGFDGSLMKGPDGVTDLKFDVFTSLGGAPNIADFDGDGRVEMSFAGFGCMVVIDVDCAVDATTRATIPLPPGCDIDPAAFAGECPSGAGVNLGNMVGVLWMRRTQDESSAVTGTSVFDFQGDGKAEVLYNDECFFRVYDGETGTVLMEAPNSTRTASEYPIVVDADGDGDSEILVGGNNDQSGTSRDCCFGTSAATCPASQRPSSPGKVSYWRTFDNTDADYYPLLDMYDYEFCTCGHLKTQNACDSRSGCAWSTQTNSCGVFNCATYANANDCNAVTGCTWTGTCGVVNCAAMDEATCRSNVPCLWNNTSATCAARPNRPDDPADICTSGTWGLWALGDQQARWVQTLPQWNEHSYHVTEVDQDGRAVPDWGPGNNNWEIYNNLRQNVQGYAPLNLPDLQIFSFVASGSLCPDILLNARVVNRGRAGVPAGVPIVFYVLDPFSVWQPIATVPLPYALLPGLGADVSTTFVPGNSGTFDFRVEANPQNPPSGGPIAECDGNNNLDNLVAFTCTIGG